MGIPKVTIDQNQEIYCYNVDSGMRCMAFKRMKCTEKCHARIGSLNQLLTIYESLKGDQYTQSKIQLIRRMIWEEEERQIKAAYQEDLHRGTKGGSSDSDSNSRASLKQKMKDNRPVDCKWNSEEREKIKALTEEFEKEHGKLPRLSRGALSRGEKKK